MKIHTKELKIALVVGFMLTVLNSINAVSRDYAKLREHQTSISNQIVRLHIIAENNSYTSNSKKMEVKRDTLKKLESLLSEVSTVAEAKKVISYNISIFESFSENLNVSLQKRYFPFIVYENFRLPSGYYKALVIEIGEASGSNWWCVLFPTLCFLEGTNGIMENHLEEYEVIFRLRIWDFLF